MQAFALIASIDAQETLYPGPEAPARQGHLACELR
jgi:hypothetical protein